MNKKPPSSREELEVRLLAHRLIDERDCWLWQLSLFSDGYGQTTVRRESGRARSVAVHRVAAHVWLGFDLDSPLRVLHHCDVRRCFNPAHLFVGTPADNSRDMVEKGRQVTARLNPDSVRAIRAARADGRTLASLGAEYGVNLATIWLACERKTWAHVE